MAPKFALFTKGSKLFLNKGFKNMFELITTVLRSTLDMRGIPILFFLFLQENIYCEYSLEVPQQGIRSA